MIPANSTSNASVGTTVRVSLSHSEQILVIPCFTQICWILTLHVCLLISGIFLGLFHEISLHTQEYCLSLHGLEICYRYSPLHR